MIDWNGNGESDSFDGFMDMMIMEDVFGENEENENCDDYDDDDFLD